MSVTGPGKEPKFELQILGGPEKGRVIVIPRNQGFIFESSLGEGRLGCLEGHHLGRW